MRGVVVGGCMEKNLVEELSLELSHVVSGGMALYFVRGMVVILRFVLPYVTCVWTFIFCSWVVAFVG